jgi:Protein of unknown function (DUF2917)
MNTSLMNNLHQDAAPWSWPLEHRAAATLRAEPAPRWLHVNEGCVWVTAQDGGPHSEDLWLGAGDSLALPAGSAWVVEAWPHARLSLLLAQPARRPAVSSSRAWWQSSWLWPWVLPDGHAGRRALA